MNRLSRTVLLAAALATGCGREERVFHVPPASGPPDPVRMSTLQPGPPTRDTAFSVYEENRWAVGEGQRLYNWFNCSGCRSRS